MKKSDADALALRMLLIQIQNNKVAPCIHIRWRM